MRLASHTARVVNDSRDCLAALPFSWANGSAEAIPRGKKGPLELKIAKPATVDPGNPET